MIDRLPDLQSQEKEPLQDACGIVGVLSSKDIRLSRIGLAGLEKLQTRGYDAAGYAGLRSDGSVLFHKAQGTISEVFTPGVAAKLDENSFYHGQWQVRYGTSGDMLLLVTFLQFPIMANFPKSVGKTIMA